jgi:hypothetical protein
MASASTPPATVSLNIDGYKFVNSGTTTPTTIYINNVELTTQKNDDLSNLFNDLYTEYKEKTPIKFTNLSGKLSDEFIKNTDSYAVCIQLQIVKIPNTTPSTTQIAPGEAVIIEFEPYVLPPTTSGGRRRTKMSKRDPMYRTRKNKK